MKENSPRSEGAKTTESVDSLKVRIRELEKEVERWKSQVKTVRYGLNWIDVPEAFDRDAEEKIPVLEEVSEKAIEAAGPLAGRPPHVIIEGDNYHALTCLNYTHRGKIDVIYIDPPYNTGSDGFTYKDKRFLTEYPDGKKVPREDPLRHSYWLSFMEKRLKLAKNLLSDKGVIFISIDDNEQANLKLLCDRIFGEGNHLATIHWRKNRKPHNAGNTMSVSYEFILVYFKNKPIKLIQDYATMDEDEKGKYAIYPVLQADKKVRTYTFTKGVFCKGEFKRGRTTSAKNDKCNVDVLDEPIIKNGVLQNDIRVSGRFRFTDEKGKLSEAMRQGNIYFTKDGIPKEKRYRNEEDSKVDTNWWDIEKGRNEDATEELATLFGITSDNTMFSNPKPVNLIKKILSDVTNRKKVFLDFFAGSGTSLHAALESCVESDNLQCILVQAPEKTYNVINGLKIAKKGSEEAFRRGFNFITDITYERNRRVMCGYTNAKGESVEGLGGSLKYYKTGFVGKHPSKSASDADKVELAGKAGCLIALAENTLETVAVPKAAGGFFQIYSDNAEKKRYTCIYYNGDYGRVPEFIAKIDELCKKDKRAKFAVYVFSWNSPDFFENEFDDLTNIEIKAIPKPILEIYKALNG